MKMTFIAILTACSMLVGTTAAWADEAPATRAPVPETNSTIVQEAPPPSATEAPAPLPEATPAPIQVEATGTATLELVPAVSPPNVLPAPAADDNKAVVVEDPPYVQKVRGPVRIKNKVPFKVGMLFDISVPSGVALGLEARLPYVPWFKFGLAGTGTLAPGVRGNILFDPIKFPIGPVLNVDVGHQFAFGVPGLKNSPTLDFTYTDLQGGIGLGSRDGFRFLLMGGMSYLGGTANNFQGVITNAPAGLKLGDPTFTGWAPNAKLGFNLLF
jgi:hypothetical protein